MSWINSTFSLKSGCLKNTERGALIVIHLIGFGVFASTQASYSPASASSAVCFSERIGSKSLNPTIFQFSRIFFIFTKV
nr:MAG TPA: hypothetical protein [Caudoviricetes sp.]